MEQEYIEDCQVCCRPMVLRVEVPQVEVPQVEERDGEPQVSVRAEDD